MKEQEKLWDWADVLALRMLAERTGFGLKGLLSEIGKRGAIGDYFMQRQRNEAEVLRRLEEFIQSTTPKPAMKPNGSGTGAKHPVAYSGEGE